MRRGFLKGFLVVVAIIPASAQAAMTYLPDSGTVARARGGAFTAKADDPTAIIYNPAGFALQRKMQLLIDLSVIKLSNSFDRTGCSPSTDPTTGTVSETPCGSVSNAGAPKISPNIVFSMPLGERLTWHAGAHGAIGTNHKYPADGPQRHINVEQNPQQLSYTTGVAWKAADWVSLGFTAGGMYTTNEQRLVSTRRQVGPPDEHPAYDSPVVLKVSDTFSPTAIFGALFTLPDEGVSLGVSYRIPTETSMGGTYEGAAGALKEDVHLKVNLPAIARFGVRRYTPTWDIELDLSIEDWTSRKEDVISVDDGLLDVGPDGVAAIHIARDGQIAFRYGIGGTYKLGESLELHAGLLHETPGVSEERLNITLMDTPKTQVSVGTTYGFSRFEVSGSLSYTHYETINVGTSEVTQRGPYRSTPQEAYAVTGNGKYSGSSMMGGISFLTKF